LKNFLVALPIAAFVSVAALAADPLPRAKPESVGMSSQRLEMIAKTIRADIEGGRIPGAVVAIARKGKLVYFEAFGYTDKTAGAPMTTDAIFNIASMTKPMVTAAALMLYEEGRVLMDDPISKYLPQFSKMQVATMNPDGSAITGTIPAVRQITVQDLMRHTSGIIYGARGNTAVHKQYQEALPSTDALSGREFLDKLGSLPLLYQPGTVWDYGYSIDVIGLMVERLSGQSLGGFLGERMFQPLGMTDTGFLVPAASLKRYTKPLPNDPDTGRPQSARDLARPLGFECGGGCLASTASDYMRFVQMLLHKGTFNGKRILGRKTVEFMLANHLSPEMRNLVGNADPTRADYGFGLGLAVRTTPGIVRLQGSVGDFSWPGASGTNWWGDPKEELAVVFMSAAPGPIRWHYRQVINALVYQSIVD
jgi:CubicO group peptidase (beta-lactamase class C family)